MQDVYKLLSLGFASAAMITAFILARPISRDHTMLWSLIVTFEIAVLVMAGGVAVAVGAGTLSLFLRRRTEYEDSRGEARRAAARGRVLDAQTVALLNRPVAAPAWPDPAFLLRDTDTANMVDVHPIETEEHYNDG